MFVSSRGFAYNNITTGFGIHRAATKPVFRTLTFIPTTHLHQPSTSVNIFNPDQNQILDSRTTLPKHILLNIIDTIYTYNISWTNTTSSHCNGSWYKFAEITAHRTLRANWAQQTLIKIQISQAVKVSTLHATPHPGLDWIAYSGKRFANLWDISRAYR